MSFLSRFVSCVFADNTQHDLRGYNVDKLSESLIDCLNRFFPECKDTRVISETRIDNLTVHQVAAFQESCLLGMSVGIEVLGRLLYNTYDKDNNYFDEQKVSELAQIDWSRRNTLWENNIIRKTGNSDYEIVNRVNPVLDAVKAVKTFLIWI